MSGATDRNRGVMTERLAVDALRGLGWPSAERAVRTGYRTATRMSPDPGDVTGTPGLVWQIKSMRPFARAEQMVPEWMVETEQQRHEAHASIGVLVVRREQHVPRRWWAFVPVVDLYGLADGFAGSLTPPAFRHVDDRETLVRWPARMELAHLCTLLRGYGFGDPLEATS